MHKTIMNLVLHDGLPTKIETDEWFADTSEHQILVFDDLMNAQTSDKMVAKIFTVGTHHKNFSIVTLNHQVNFPTENLRKTHILEHPLLSGKGSVNRPD